MINNQNTISITDGWRLAGYYTYGTMVNKAMENGTLPSPCAECPATVPGSVTRDLVTAGLLPDPYFEQNSLAQEWVGNRHWVYTNDNILLPADMQGKRIRLVFRGVDYKAHVYFNGAQLGSHVGMFETFSFDITALARFDRPNTLSVCLEHAPFEHSYTGYISQKSTVKTHCSYRWDFCPRLVDCGIYDEVCITADGGCSLDYITPVWDGQTLHVDYSAEGEFAAVRATLTYLGEPVACSQTQKGERLTLKIEAPRLWYPVGYGEQPLYRLSLEPLNESGTSLGRYSCNCGLRTLSYEQLPEAPADALPYRLVVNGKRIRTDGVDLCPIDLMFGAVTDQRYETLVRQIVEGGFTMVRMWGGGNLERSHFYDLCDRAGLVILHDFLQSNVTTCDQPNDDPTFLQFFGRIMRHVARTLSAHPSVVMYSGGNEIRDPATGSTIGMDHPNIALLRSIVAECAPGTLFLPTCGSGPWPLIDPDRLDRYYHDAHGPWMYGGPQEHYRIWNNFRAMFNSEFGCNGMTNLSALRRIFSPEKLESPQLDTWLTRPDIRHHHDGWDSYQRDSGLFGPLSLTEYVALSQYIMGESLRYSLESGRRRDRDNCGMLVWQMNEPWPNSACTNLVDYYGTPKLAYFLVREALKKDHASLRYDSLVYRPGEAMALTPFVHATEAGRTGTLTLSCGSFIVRHSFVTGEYALELDTITIPAPADAASLTVTLTLELDGAAADQCSYLFFVADSLCDKSAALAYIKQTYPQAEISAYL